MRRQFLNGKLSYSTYIKEVNLIDRNKYIAMNQNYFQNKRQKV